MVLAVLLSVCASTRGGNLLEDEPKRPPSPISKAAILALMKTVRPQVDACYQTFHVGGYVAVGITVRRDGQVQEVNVSGDFRDTPTGDCIIEAVKGLRFPRFLRRRPLVFTYPILLR